MSQRSRTAARRRASRKRVLLVEADELKRRALARVLRLAGYRVYAFAQAGGASRRVLACDVVVLTVPGGHDAGARGLLAAAARAGGDGRPRPRVGVICPDAVTAREVGAQADRSFLAPLDCGALLRWVAVDGLSHIGGTIRDWVDVFASLNEGHEIPARPGVDGEVLRVAASW